MTSLSDLQWRHWEQTWVTVGEDAPARWVRRLVERQSRMLRLIVAIDVAITVAVLIATAWMVRDLPPIVSGTVLGATILHSIVVWGFTVRNRSGIWSPLGETMRDYLALASERCRRELRASRFALRLLAVEGLLLAIWVWIRDPATRRPAPYPFWWVPSAVAVAAVIIWAVWVERRARRRLQRLDEAARQLGIDSP